MAEGLKDFFAGLGGVFSNIFNSLTGGTANAATGNPADYLDGGGIGGSTAERNAAAFLSTLEGGSGQNAADTFQVMLNRTANAKKGGAMKAYGNTLFDQITAQSQFSPFSAAIHDKATGDRAADKKYGAIRSKLGKNAAERKAKLLEIAGQPDGIAQLQRLFNAGSATEASKILKDFETGGTLSKESAKGVRGAVSFRGQSLIGNMKAGDFYRGTGGNFFFNGLGGQAAGLSAVSAEPPSGGVLNTGRLPALPKTGTMHGQAYGANRRGGRKHAGVDFDISGNEKFFSRIGGVVTKVGYDPSGYGNYIDIYNEELKVTERIAEGAKVLVRQGQKVSAGSPVVQGETDTGVIHYEIRKGQGGYGFTSTLNPLNFLSSVSSKSKDTASGGGGAPAAAQVNRGGQRGGGSSPGSLQASAANPNTGTPMMATSQQVAMASTGGGAAPTIINNYYGGGGQSGGVNPNGVAPGIGMEQTGTSVFQDLRIRALA
jgi:murein DD-endopeptidase MepM/ murein hydrolase activator NlpD